MKKCINKTRFSGPLWVKLFVLFLWIPVFWPATPLEAHWKIPGSVKNWKILNTTRYKIHYPEGYEQMALQAAVYAEEASVRLERVMEHRVTHVIPVFIYASHQDFSSTNMFPGIIGEGTGGFTDFYRRRVVVPFNGSYNSLRHVLTHEIVHAYQFSILKGNFGAYPLWLMEGMAEYLSIGWDRSAELLVRDAVLYNRMPTLLDLHIGRVSSGYMYYKGGQAVMMFIGETWGEKYIVRFLKELSALKNMYLAIESVFKIQPEEFDIQLGDFLRRRYGKAMGLKRDDRYRRVTFRYRDRLGFNLNPALSPDGKSIAYMTVAGIFPAVAVRPVPGPGVTEEKASRRRIVIRALRTKDYEEWQPLTTRLSFSADGKNIILAGRRAGRQAVLVINIKKGKVIRSYEPPFDAIHFPAAGPKGKYLYFTGVVRGKSDLFRMRLKTGAILRLTDDWNYETRPRTSRDGKALYYSSNRGPGAKGQKAINDGDNRYLYRLDLLKPGARAQLLTNMPGVADNPMPALDGSLIFSSDHTGVPNLYRLPRARNRNTPAEAKELQPVTSSQTGILNAALHIQKEAKGVERELAVVTELEEGAYELKILPAGVTENGLKVKNPNLITPAELLPVEARTFWPGRYRNPTRGLPLDTPLKTKELGLPYKPSLAFEGSPFLLVAGDGGGAFSFFAFGQFSDDTGDHKLRAIINYVTNPSNGNLDFQYQYLKYRMDFFAGVYRQDGVFPISILDFSFNNILYNPNFRIIDQDSVGFYYGMEYPLHRFGSLVLAGEQGREERRVRQTLAEEREQKSVYKNFNQLSLQYKYDNVVYSYFGALDGHLASLSHSTPMRVTATERETYVTSFQYNFYHMFSSYNTFALKTFASTVTGRDATDYPYRLGGIYTLRGYDFLEFEGTKAFMVNLEYRFTLVPQLNFAWPGRWSLGTIRAVAFFDAGGAFDDYKEWQGYDGRAGVTRDLHLSFGIGLMWVNFLQPILPGTVMRIDWATPFDTKRARPLSKWRGQFSLGFAFD